MECTECGFGMEQIDTTYSNVTTERVREGEHTGDVYKCNKCDIMILDNLVTGESERWTY